MLLGDREASCNHNRDGELTSSDENGYEYQAVPQNLGSKPG